MILVLTSWPSPEIDHKLVDGSDKVAHFGVYFILGVLTWRALAVPRGMKALLAALAAMYVFGLVDEVHQAFVPGRDASVFDWMADLLGATAGLVLAPRLLSLARRRQDLLT